MEIGKKGIYVVQSLIVSYIITGIILCVLALIMYQLKSGIKIAESRSDGDLHSGFNGSRVDCRQKNRKKKILWDWHQEFFIF